jgi:hypothetical protein
MISDEAVAEKHDAVPVTAGRGTGEGRSILLQR